MKASGWKRRIVAACKTAGTYSEQYTAVIDTLAANPDAHTGQNERGRIHLYHKEEIQHRPAHIGTNASPLHSTNQHRYQQFKN